MLPNVGKFRSYPHILLRIEKPRHKFTVAGLENLNFLR